MIFSVLLVVCSGVIVRPSASHRSRTFDHAGNGSTSAATARTRKEYSQYPHGVTPSTHMGY
jgi:hypothetical protein